MRSYTCTCGEVLTGNNDDAVMTKYEDHMKNFHQKEYDEMMKMPKNEQQSKMKGIRAMITGS